MTVGKNYLTQNELEDLGRLVAAYLNLAELRAKRDIPTTMEEWTQFLDQVLTLDARELLTNAGIISKQMADRFALEEYEKFRVTQDAHYVSDFDAFVEAGQKTIKRGHG